MKRIGLLCAWLLVCGCAAPLPRADRLLTEGNLPLARDQYQLVLQEQQRQAELPVWTGKEYVYRFDRQAAARAIYGIGETYRREKRDGDALYYYFYYLTFCRRNAVACEREAEQIRAYLREVRPGTNGVVYGENVDAGLSAK